MVNNKKLQMFLKRTLDIFVSSLGLIILFPLFIIFFSPLEKIKKFVADEYSRKPKLDKPLPKRDNVRFARHSVHFHFVIPEFVFEGERNIVCPPFGL